jgi:Butirosin biosynthesis protein H, N-terminal/Domain of unknown function (DUF4872)
MSSPITATYPAAVSTGQGCIAVRDFANFGGRHCETSALQKVLDHAGIHYSEEFLFGMAGGAGFVFWLAGNETVPFVGGRNGKFPEFIMRAGEAVGQKVSVVTTTSDKRAYQRLIAELEQGQPVVCYGDILFLPYFHASRHFGGHAFVVYGIDEANDQVWISDRGREPQTVSRSDLAMARNSKTKVFAPHNAQLQITMDATAELGKESVRRAVLESCDAMRNPPIRNFGLPGLEKFRSYLRDAFSRLPALALCDLALTTYVNLQLAGTGGCAFRRMYRDFLIEAADCDRRLPLDEALPWLNRAIIAWGKLIDGLLPPIGAAISELRKNLDAKERAFEQGGEEGFQLGSRCQAEIQRLRPDAAGELSRHRAELMEAADHLQEIQREEAACFEILDRRLR